MPKSKKFIDKNKSVSFQLVHRSQQDPLVVDETAPQHVLKPIVDKQARLEEQHKYGIYFDDDSDYLQHLKERDDHRVEWPEHAETLLEERRTQLCLPSSVFASTVEEEVGVLNKAPPQSGLRLDLDPDIVAAMDDDFDYSDPENQLEDNFVQLAEGLTSDAEIDDEDEVGSLPDSDIFKDEETKSRFTTYSMSSSVIRRNEQLTLLDDRFEKAYADYDDNEIGALDCEEIEGYVPENSEILIQYAEEFRKNRQNEQLDKEVILEKVLKTLDGSDNEEDDMVYVPVDEKEKWDCETILSTYSNLYNHPKLIEEPKNRIKVNRRTGIPIDVLDANRLTKKALEELNSEYDKERNGPGIGSKSVGNQSIISQLSVLSIRPKDESPDERKERKKLLKEYRKERRLEKKMNSIAFKEEAKRQNKIAINNRNNVQGNKVL